MSNILLITNKSDVTTDFVVKELQRRQVKFYRFNTDNIGISVFITLNLEREEYRMSDRQLGIELNLKDVTAVYFRRPELPPIPTGLTEGESNFVKSENLYLLEGLYRVLSDAYWVSDINAIRQAENKIYQLLVAKQIGFQTPPSSITNASKDALSFYETCDESCIIKPLRSGLIEGHFEEGVIFTSRVHLNSENIQRIELCPTYLQQLIRKQYDVRVTIVGTTIFAALIDSQGTEEAVIDWRRTDSILPYRKLTLPDDIASKCLELLKRLNLKFGAIDFVIDTQGKYIFLEINPNGQWAWIEKQLNYEISKEIVSSLVGQGDL